MALTSCPECQNSVSSVAQSCPHCGFPLFENTPVHNRYRTTSRYQKYRKEPKQRSMGYYLGMAIIAVLLLLYAFGGLR